MSSNLPTFQLGESTGTLGGKGERGEGGPGIPRSPEEAAKWAAVVGVPAQFARDIWEQMEAVGWIDGMKRPIQSFARYVARRYSMQRNVENEVKMPEHRARKVATEYQQPEMQPKLL